MPADIVDALGTVTYRNWDDPTARTLPAPAAPVRFSNLKRLALSGLHYRDALDAPNEPSARMLLGTCVSQLTIGPQKGKPPCEMFPAKLGKSRESKAFAEFQAERPNVEILLEKEWALAERIAASLRAHPVARARLEGATYETPLEWEDGGFKCTTGGVDLIVAKTLGDLKTTTTVHPATFERLAFKMLYHCQLAWYRRGARANGIEVAERPFVLAVETKPPFDVIELRATERLMDLGDRTVTLWLEQLRTFEESNQWPGYAQAPVDWDVPPWMQPSEEDEDGDEGEAVGF